MAEFVSAAKTKDLSPGEGKRIEIGDKKIALFNVEGVYYAIDDTCTHRGGPLSEGELEGNEITCPWHGATFDLTTGAALGGPAPKGVSRYNVRVSGDQIEIEI